MARMTVKKFFKWVLWLLLFTVVLLLLGAVIIYTSPRWLRPHKPLQGVDAFVVEGFLLEHEPELIAEHCNQYPGLPIYITGVNRTSLVFQTNEPGEFLWKFDRPHTSYDLTGQLPHIQLKGHSKGCRGRKGIWRVMVNGDTLFDDKMPNFQPREFEYKSESALAPIEELRIQFDHPNPDSTCQWVIWYLFVDGMEVSRQEVTFTPEGQSEPTWVGGTMAETGQRKLLDAGVISSEVVAVPGPPAVRMRTYLSALALAEYLENHPHEIQRVNVITRDYHARRSWEAIRKVLKKQGIEVGVVNLEPEDRDLREIWNDPEDQGHLKQQLRKYAGWLVWQLVP